VPAKMDVTEIPVRISTGVTENETREQLERVLSSEPFRHSKRHPRFLRFVVEQTLAGNAQELKERVIGMEVFDRVADYDLASDPIVRVAAGEIRKRLAQYYLDDVRSTELRFELLPGSYVPTFYWPALPHAAIAAPAAFPGDLPSEPSTAPAHQVPLTTPPVATRHPSAKTFWGAGLSLIVLAAIGGWTVVASRHASEPARNLAAFWSPMVQGSSTLICVGDLNFLMVDPAPVESESLEQLMRGRNHLGQSNVAAVARLSSMLGAKGVNSSVLLADSANLTDLRGQPTLMIGAFDNRWTKLILQDARFQIEWNRETRRAQIIDHRNGQQHDWFVDFSLPLGQIKRDYAIVARTFSPLTGQQAIAIAGVGPYGTSAASEFVTSPAYFEQFVAQAPRDWQTKTLEIVLTTQVVEGRSSPPQIVTYDVH
jgi:hypothetical protein